MSRRFLALFILFSLFASVGNSQTAEINKRAVQMLKSRKTGVTAQSMLTVLQREKEPSLVCLGAGMMLETAGTTARDAVQLLMAAQDRPDCFHQIAAQVMVTSMAQETVDLIVAQKGKESQWVAASLMAIRSQINMKAAKAKGKKGKGKGPKIGGPVDFKSGLETLLSSKDQGVLELALLAAAYTETDVDASVEKLKLKKSGGTLGARLLYLASRGKGLDAKEVKAFLKSKMKGDKRFEKVSAALSSYSPTSHPLCYLAQAIGLAGDYQYLDQLHDGLSHKDIRVQIDSAKAIEMLGKNESLPSLMKVLPTCVWPTKVHVLSAIGAIPNEDSIAPLIAQMKTETGRFRLDCIYAIGSIMGKNEDTDLAGWEAAWNEVASSFKPDKAKTKAFRKKHTVADMWVKPLGSFYTLRVFSDRLVYVVDTSASMKGEKIKDLELNLADSTSSLQDPARFNIVTFGGEITLGSNEMQTAEQGDYISGQLNNLKLSFATRTHDAIQVGSQFNEADTIYYLSDGAPVSGAFFHWNAIIPTYKYYHRYRPIALFAVEFKAGATNSNMMKKFARQNYGKSGGTDDAADE